MILIVEDEPYIGQNIGMLCDDLGLRSALAQTGAEALKVLASVVVRLVIVDMRLPDMSGVALIKAIRRLPAPANATPILVESGESQRIIRQALVAGANGAIEKPYSLALMRERIISLMRPEQ